MPAEKVRNMLISWGWRSLDISANLWLPISSVATVVRIGFGMGAIPMFGPMRV